MDPTQPLLPLDDVPRVAPAARPPRPSPPPARTAAPPPASVPEITGARPGQLPLLLTVRDVEAELQRGRTRTYELVRSGELPVVRLGRVVRVPRHGLERWIASRTANDGDELPRAFSPRLPLPRWSPQCRPTAAAPRA